MTNKNTHGGPGRGQGRHKEPGYQKLMKVRFLSESEEKALRGAKFSPRRRVEILLMAISLIAAERRTDGRSDTV